MTHPSTARRPATWLLVLAIVLSGVTRTGLSLATSSQSHEGPKAHKAPATAPGHAALRHGPAQPNTATPKAKHAALPAKAARKTPTNTRVAAKSKVTKQPHKAASKPPQSVAKNSKHAA